MSDLLHTLQSLHTGMVQLGVSTKPSYAYVSTYDYVVKNGLAMLPGQLCEASQALLTRIQAKRHFRERECFGNSQALAKLTRGKFRYCEGYALAANSIPFPILHAWVIDAVGTVIDVTWRQPGYEYLGVVFDKNQALAGQGGSLIDDWENQWPLLRA